MPGNEYYTVRAGDSLSKIAKRYGLASWQDIYEHEKNAGFRKKRPDPDKIEPGDKIWVPEPPSGKLSAAVLKKTRFVRKQGTLSVTEISFDGEEDIWYVRLDKKNRDYIAPEAAFDKGKSYAHIPAKVYPENASPHWKHDAAKGKAIVNWPAIYIRDGAKTAAAPKRKLTVSFRFNPPIKGSLHIKADGPEGIAIAEQEVKFDTGIADNIDFAFSTLPATVRKLENIALRWSFRKPDQKEFTPGAVTNHTLFIIDARPIPSNAGLFDLLKSNRIVYEVCDWSCSWANGKKGAAEVLEAIWSRFNPVKAKHDTGFVYWKLKVEQGIQPVGDLFDAIQCQDKNEPYRNAVNCQVFDYIFIHCLCIQGIPAAEIAMVHNNVTPAGFDKDGKKYMCKCWMPYSRYGQGNPNGPPVWVSHWVADVNDGSGNWKLYDPSYGGAPQSSDEPAIVNPAVLNFVDMLNYERKNVKLFACNESGLPPPPPLPQADMPKQIWGCVKFAPSDDPNVPPHLVGVVRWSP
jgi:hypothetical protein